MRSRQLGTGKRHGHAAVTAVAVAVTAVGLLGSGCAIPNFDNPASKSTGREIPPPPEVATPEAGQGSLTGTWSGTYTCPQGVTQLNLGLVQKPDGAINGIFEFSPAPGDEGAGAGSFTLAGRVSGSSLILRGDRWIDRPANYEMVDLTARLSASDPDVIRGEISAPGCGGFIVRRG